MKSKKLKEILSYILVGLGGLLIDFSFFYILRTYLDLEMLTAQWIASFLGFMHNHLWQHFVVFEHNQNLKKTYLQNFVLTFIFVILAGPMLLFISRFSQSVWLNKIIVIGVNTIILYFVRKSFIFIYKKND